MYSDFAYCYDALTEDVDYSKIAEFISGILKKNFSGRYAPVGSEENLIVDLGCGTGSLMKCLTDKGFDMIGIDASEEMLECAREKLPEALLLCQNATEMELYGTVAAIVSSLDCLNHITDKDDFSSVFKLVANYLDDNGIFIFDVLTGNYFDEVARKGSYHEIRDDLVCIWQCEKGQDDYKYDITLFVSPDDEQDDEQVFFRFDESFCEKAYSREYIEKCIADAGMQLLSVNDDYTDAEANEKTERMVFVCRRPLRNSKK